MAGHEPLEFIDPGALRRWARLARAELSSTAAPLDALNVFPVPDADTGTNLLLTFENALFAERFAVADDAGITELTDAFARASVLAARGNSGVILSQLARGIAQAVTEAPGGRMGPGELAHGLRVAASYAREAVADPREGTILTVADAAAAAATDAVAAGTLVEVVRAAAQAAGTTLTESATLLPALRDTGLVDAGGAGFVVLLDVLLAVVEQRPARAEAADAAWWPVVTGVEVTSACDRPLDPGGPAYELMLVLEDSTQQAVADLRGDLSELGDSIVIAGDDELRSVHVHTDALAAALERCARAGRTSGVEVTRFADQVAGSGLAAPATQLVLLTRAPGLADIARALGATVTGDGLLEGSVGHVVDAAAESLDDERDLLVLATSPGDLAVARAAEQLIGRPRRVAVTAADHEATAVVAMHLWASQPLTATLPAVAAECDDVVSAVSVADVVRAGDGYLLTADGSQYADPAAATRAAVEHAWHPAAEIVTIVRGADVPWAPVVQAMSQIAHAHPDVHVDLVFGGGETALSVGVE